MNVVILEGKVVREPDVKYFGSGKCMCKFTVVTSEYEKDSGSFHSCVAWGKQAELIGNMGLSKGDRISLVGKGRSGNYKDKNGRTVYTYDINVSIIDTDRKGIIESTKCTPKKVEEEQEKFSDFGKAIAEKPEGVDF